MSAAVPTTTSSASPWRAGVIGVVALLAAGIGLAAGGFLTTSRAAEIGPGAAYAPAGAAFYVEMRLEPSGTQDAALREFLGAFPEIAELDLDRPLYEQMVEKVDEMLAESDAGVTWEEEVAPWFDGRVSVTVAEIPVDELGAAPIDPLDPSVPLPMGGETPPMVVTLGVRDRAAADAAIDRVVAAADLTASEETTHEGVTITSVTDSGSPTAWALTDDVLLLGPTVGDVTAALDAHAAPDTTLAEAEHLAELAGQLPDDWLAFVTYDMTEIVAASWDAMASMEPEVSDALQSLLDHQSLRGAMAFTAGGDRLSLETVTSAPTGPFTTENADRGLADEVPGDTLYYAEGGNIGATLSGVIGPMKEAFATTPAGAEQVEMIEDVLGADLEELVSWVDDAAIAVGWDGEQAYGGMVLVPADVDAASRRLSQLGTFATLAGMDPGSGISVDEREVAGTTITTIRWDGPSAGQMDAMMPMPTSLAIEYTVTEDRALLGIGDRFVERVLTMEGSGSLADSARFTDAIADLGGPTNAGAAWLDLAGIRVAIEDAASPMIDEYDTDGAYERDIQPWLLPLDRIVQVAILDGDTLVQRSALLVE